MKNRKLTSENLAEFLNFMKEVEIEYSTALSMMKKCENLECDLLHQLEIEKLSVSDKNKLATKLRDCLRDRRYYKNIEIFTKNTRKEEWICLKRHLHCFLQQHWQLESPPVPAERTGKTIPAMHIG